MNEIILFYIIFAAIIGGEITYAWNASAIKRGNDMPFKSLDDQYRVRKPKYWEPPFVQVPVSELQRVVWEVVNDVLLSGGASQGGGGTVVNNAATVSLVSQIKDMIMSLSNEVKSLVDQIEANKSIEASSAAAMGQLVTQSKANADQITKLMAQVAAGSALSPEDAAAIAKGAVDLHDSATALQAAVPANVTPAT